MTTHAHHGRTSGPSRVLLIGATGLIGRAVGRRLQSPNHEGRYEVVELSRHGTPAIDLERRDSIARCFEALVPFEHVIVAAGEARFGSVFDLDEEAFWLGLRSKLMGQVNVTLAALPLLPSRGSITLTSGALAHEPIEGSAAVALVNGALESFVRAIRLDLPRGPRVNVVSPGWIKETMTRLGLDPTPGVAADEVAALYERTLEGSLHGEVLTQQRPATHLRNASALRTSA